MNRTDVKDLGFGKTEEMIVVEVLDPQMRKTSTGGDYFQFVGRDGTGAIDFKVWKPKLIPGGCQEKEDLPAGTIAKFKVTDVNDYRGTRQIRGFTYDVIPPGHEKCDQYAEQVRFGPSDAELDEFVGLVRKALSGISHPQLKKACQSFFKSTLARFRQCPASPHKDGHHGYDGGYAKHVHGVMKLARVHAKMVGDKYVNLDLVTAGAFFHDVGKFASYAEKGLNRTKAGRLLGHIAQGLPVVAKLCEEHGVDDETATMLQHIVVSHHGKKDYGSPEIPMTIEAEIVCWADMADSKVEHVRMKLQNGLPPGEFVGNHNFGIHTAYLPPEPEGEEG